VIISLIAAVDERGGMGRDGGLPWHLSDDLKNFKRVTMGHHLIMGRRTFESIQKELEGRELIVLSRDEEYWAKGADAARSLEEALAIASEAGEEEVFVIGGREVFAQAIPMADRFYLTQVQAKVSADTKFPEFDLSEWDLVESQRFELGPKNDYAFTIKKLMRAR
jgi:dihydrofolate reductase